MKKKVTQTISEEDLIELEVNLNYKFKSKELFLEALTHKSFKKEINNERLEFLGDAVLDLIIGELLYIKFPNSNEGELSKMRAALVNEEGFNILAKFINLGKYIFISPAEENNKGREKPSLLSNAFEAIIGAIYLEAGLKEVEKIVYNLIDKNYDSIDLDSLFKDYKTAIQELTQAYYGVTPEYRTLKSFGPDHKKEFEIAVFIQDKEYAKAKGKSKKVAQQEAALIALEILKNSSK